MELDVGVFQVWISMEKGKKYGNILVFPGYCNRLADYVFLKKTEFTY